MRRLFEEENLPQRNGDGRIVGIDLHDVAHVAPPFPNHGIVAHLLRGTFAADLLIGEQHEGVGIVKNRVIANAALFEQLFHFGPKASVAFFVFRLAAGFELHFESQSLHNFRIRILGCRFACGRRWTVPVFVLGYTKIGRCFYSQIKLFDIWIEKNDNSNKLLSDTFIMYITIVFSLLDCTVCFDLSSCHFFNFFCQND